MRFIFTVLFSLALIVSAYSQFYTWELKQAGSSLGGPIDVEQFNHNNVYYGSDNKVYKSTDRGENFTQMGINVPQATEIKCVLVDNYNPSTIVVGIEGGLIKLLRLQTLGHPGQLLPMVNLFIFWNSNYTRSKSSRYIVYDERN